MATNFILRLEQPAVAMRVDDYSGKPYGDWFTLSAGPGGLFVRRIRHFDTVAGVELYRMEISSSGDWYDHWQIVEVQGQPVTKEVPESTRP
jgi:hypothetical protein